MRISLRLLAVLCVIASFAASSSAQFFALSGGCDGFNFTFANAYPYYTVPVIIEDAPPPHHHRPVRPHHRAIHIPMLPGLDYPVVHHTSRRVVRHYEEVVVENNISTAISFPGGGGITLSIPIAGSSHHVDAPHHHHYKEPKFRHKIHHKKPERKAPYHHDRRHNSHKHKRHHHDD